LIAVDVSKSMLARDVVPDRLTRAKLAITDLADGLEGDRLGLIAFAGSAFLQCPLTLDRTAFLESLGALAPGIVETPGSDLGSALTVAEEALRTEGRNVKLLVVFSDGEDLGGGAIPAAERIAKAGVKVYTVGVGSPAGELVPMPQADGGTGFVRDERGEFVKSKLDEATLQAIAEKTGGFYVPLGQHGEGVKSLIDGALQPIPKEELAARMRRVPIDRYRWPLAAATLLLAAEWLLRERRSPASGRRGAARSAALLLALVPALAGEARASARSALSRFESGDYAGAMEEYQALAKRDAEDARLDFNVGASAYKAGKFEAAASAFARALRSPDQAQQAMAFYNLGNADFRLGQETLERDREATRKSWQQALDAYDGSLRIRPDDADARHNREVVAAALEKMRQEDEQKKQEEQEKKDQEKKDQQQDPQDQQQGQGDDQQKQDQQQGGEGQQQDGQAGTPTPSEGEGPAPSPSPADGSGPGATPSPGTEGSDRPTPGDGESPDAAATPSPAPGDGAGAPTPTASGGGAGGEPGSQASPGAQPSPGAAGGTGGEPGDEEPQGEDDGSSGQLGPRDAGTLLDSLRGEERRVPLFGGSNGRPPRASDTVRDW
ncbi:MAG: VWA domain-containing protein, partial [Alphaproteobacteria bacterium]